MELTPMQTLLNDIGSFIGAVFSEWINPVIEAVTDTPVLLTFVVAVPLAGLGVGIFNRLVHSN